MVLVLLFGILVRAALPGQVESLGEGISFCAKTILRIGVALLGFRVVVSDVVALGPQTFILVLTSLITTVCGGYAIARMIRQPADIAAVSATSVAVCGASAALAASAVMPKRDGLERETMLVILIVSLLSTLVMVVYPWVARELSLDQRGTAVLIGAAIHDVAQVAGAGFSVSPEVGVEAVTVKMIRVACLLPVVIAFGALMVKQVKPRAPVLTRILVPVFLIAFLVIAILAATGLVPTSVITIGGQAAGWALTASVAALGLRTNFGEIRLADPKLILTLILQTIWQLALVVLLILFLL